MRKFWLLTALLLLCSAWVVAQSTAPAASSDSSQASASQTSASSSQTSDSDGMKTIEGCLSGSAGNWTLTDSSGKTYQLQGDDSKLSKEVGHQVKISGKEIGASASATTSSGATASANTSSSETNPPKAESNPSTGTAGQSGSASAAIQFKVKSVERVSDNCSNK